MSISPILGGVQLDALNKVAVPGQVHKSALSLSDEELVATELHLRQLIYTAKVYAEALGHAYEGRGADRQQAWVKSKGLIDAAWKATS